MAGKQLRWAIALCILATVLPVRAEDCVSILRTVAHPVVYPNIAAGPVAVSGSVLGVIKNATDGTRSIYFSTYDLGLNQLTEDRMVASTSYDRALALLSSGSEFALFYRDQGGLLLMQRLSLSGQVIGSAISVGTSHLAWNSSQFGFTWDSFRGLYLIVESIPQGSSNGLWLMGITPDGTLKIDQRLSFFFAAEPEPAIAVTSSGTIGVVWGVAESPTANGTTLALQTLDSKGGFSVALQFGTNARSPRIATDGSQFLITWSSAQTGGGTLLEWLRASLTGMALQSERKLLTAKGVDVAPVSLMWNAARGEWALAYLDAVLGFRAFPAELRLFRFMTAGTLIGDSYFSPDATKNLVSTPYPFIWTGRGYVTGVERFISNVEGSDSYLISHCPLTAIITADNSYPAPGAAVAFDAAVSGGSPSYTYVWDFGDQNGTANVKNPRHTYVFAGDYTVTLTTTDSTQGVSKATFVIHAGGTSPCPLPRGAPPPGSVPPLVSTPLAYLGTPITFTAPYPNDSGITFTWNFGDGTAGSGRTVSHVFASTGTYFVSYVRVVTPADPCNSPLGGTTVVRVVSSTRRRAK
jgi:hypothetical protein